MTNISTGLQETPGLQPTELGIEADTQSAYRGRALYDQAAAGLEQAGAKIGEGIASAGKAYDDFMTHRDISARAKHGTDLMANLTQSWNETEKQADPNDPSVAQKWREEVLEPQLEQFQDGAATMRSGEWTERYVDELRNHFFEKSAAGMSNLAGIAAVSNMNDIKNRLSSTAINDPSAVPFLLNNVDHLIGGVVDSSPNLLAETAAKIKTEQSQQIKEEVVKSGMYGAIQNAADPEAAVKAWTAKYPGLVNGPEAEVFARQAKVQARMLANANKASLLYQRELDNQGVAVQRNKIWSDNVTVAPDGKVTIAPQFFKDAAGLPAKYPNAPQAIETARTLLDWGERQQQPKGEKEVSDPATSAALDGRMFDQENPTSTLDVLKAEAAGKMTRQAGAIRLDLIKARDATGNRDPILTDALNNARDMIEPFVFQLGQRIGQDRTAAFQLQFLTEYQKEKAAGTLKPNALDLNDPKSLISQTLLPYRPSLARAVLANGGVGQASAGPKLPAVGFEKGGFRFKGGDPSKPENWAKVQ